MKKEDVKKPMMQVEFTDTQASDIERRKKEEEAKKKKETSAGASDKTSSLKEAQNKETIDQLTKDIATIGEWRKSGKAFTSEQQTFANQVVDKMFDMRFGKQAGIQIVSKSNMDFIKSQKIQGEATVTLPTSAQIDAPFKVQSPDIANIKIESPDNQDDGEVSSTADAGVKAKNSEGEVDEEIPSEVIGDNTSLPMPKKMAEDLIGNARWGYEIDVYGSIEEGIDAQLTNKEYKEFIDTDEKLKTVKVYLKNLIGETEVEQVA